MSAYNFTVNQGETTRLSVTYKDDADAAIDLTGFSVRMMIRKSYKSESPDISLTSSPPAGLTITAVEGKIDILLTAVQTASLQAPREYVYDLEIENVSGEVTRLLSGTITTTPEVTK